MEAREISLSDYCSFTESEAGIFSSRRWLEIYGRQLVCVGVFRDEKQLAAAFYFLSSRKAGLSFMKLPPYTPHCGFVMKNQASNLSSRNSFIKEALSAAARFVKQRRSAITVLAFPSDVKDMQPFIWERFKVIPNYTYRIGLDKTLEEIRKQYDPKSRNLSSKALKEGVACHVDLSPKEDLCRYFQAALASAGANVYQNALQGIFTKFADSSNSFSCTAMKDGNPLGSVFCVHDRDVCYYLLAGTEKRSGINGINNLLVETAIAEAKSRGCRVFDFEGSMLKGVEKFFRGFGGELVPYFTVNKALLPLEMLLKFKKPSVF